jgi:GDP-D-mannose dehydratase
MSRLLINKNIRVIGVTRDKKQRFKNHILLNTFKKINIVSIDKYNHKNIHRLINDCKPCYIYNFSGESSVSNSYKNFKETYYSIIEVTEIILKCINLIDKKIKFFNTASSECYGNYGGIINEDSPFFPVSPYGIAKSEAFEITKYYRNNKNIFSSSGIMFNHESPLRNNKFVIKKIFNSIKTIKQNSNYKVKLGNIDIRRDWGWAPDFMKAAFLILQHKIPEDYVICSNNYSSLRTFIKKSFNFHNLNYLDHVIINKNLFRNNDILSSKGSNKKIVSKLKWNPKNKVNDIIHKISNNIYD